MKTECGIFSWIGQKDKDRYKVINGLKNLQHRGRESYGISYVCNNDDVSLSESYKINVHKKMGIVKDMEELKDIYSHSWLGHVRYSTAGKKQSDENDVEFMNKCQPIVDINDGLGYYSIAHNGNIPLYVWEKIMGNNELFIVPNYKELSDTQILNYYISFLFQKNKWRESKNEIWKHILISIIDNIPGAFCIVIQTGDGVWILRDRFGLRPLTIMKNNKEVYISSETVGFDTIYSPLVNVKAGQLIHIPYYSLKLEMIYKYTNVVNKECVFEYLYFLRDNTIINNKVVSHFRMQVGKSLKTQIEMKLPDLIKRWKNDDTIVCGVPSSGIMFGKGMAKALELPYSQFLKKRKDYPWRTFILGTNDKRIQACQKKYLIEDDVIENKTIILVDDSIVRGNTLTYLIKYIKMYGPKEIHIISGSPPIKYSCHYGVDFPDMEELFANNVDVKDMPKHFDVDSVIYLDVETLTSLKKDVCNACMTGNYLF